MDLTLEIFQGSDQETRLHEIEKTRLVAWKGTLSSSTLLIKFRIDQCDWDAWHICLTDRVSNRILACSRLSIHQTTGTIPDLMNLDPVVDRFSFPLALMSRLAVLPDFRGQGFAARMDKKRIDIGRELSAREIWVEAQEPRISSLKTQGFHLESKSADLSIPGDWFLLRLQLQD